MRSQKSQNSNVQLGNQIEIIGISLIIKLYTHLVLRKCINQVIYNVKAHQ